MTAQSHHLWASQVPGRQCRQTRGPSREAATPSRRDLGKDGRLGHNLVFGLPPNVSSVVVHIVTKSWKEGIALNVGYNEIHPLLYYGHYTFGTNLCIVKLAPFPGLPYLPVFFIQLHSIKSWGWRRPGNEAYQSIILVPWQPYCQNVSIWVSGKNNSYQNLSSQYN